MKHYMTPEAAEAYLAQNPGLQYPNLDQCEIDYPMIDPPVPHPVSGEPLKPSPVVREVMHLIGDEEPKRVLDLGAGTGTTGMYLAAYGHDVTMIDHPQPMAWQNHWAQMLGLSDNLRGIPGDARMLYEDPTLSATEKYDVIINEMMLHFLEKEESRKLVAAMRAATLMGGFNVLSVYTEDNPDGELSPARGLKQLFSEGSLPAMYSSDEWETVHYQEGHGHRFVERDFIEKGMVLIPSAAELVVRKVAEPTPSIFQLPTDLGMDYLQFTVDN